MCFRERRDESHAVSFLSANTVAYVSFAVRLKGTDERYDIEYWVWLSRCFLGSADARQKSAVTPAQTSISHHNA